jgi:hypothetical protein
MCHNINDQQFADVIVKPSLATTMCKTVLCKLSYYLTKETSKYSPHNDTPQDDNPLDVTLNNNPPGDTPLDGTHYNTHQPSNNHSSNDNSPSSDTAEPMNILAFRTITTMLSWIQQAQAFQVAEAKPIEDDMACLKLKILNALSTVSVIDNEVVAVVAKHDNVGKLKVIACACLPNDEN